MAPQNRPTVQGKLVGIVCYKLLKWKQNAIGSQHSVAVNLNTVKLILDQIGWISIKHSLGYCEVDLKSDLLNKAQLRVLRSRRRDEPQQHSPHVFARSFLNKGITRGHRRGDEADEGLPTCR